MNQPTYPLYDTAVSSSNTANRSFPNPHHLDDQLLADTNHIPSSGVHSQNPSSDYYTTVTPYHTITHPSQASYRQLHAGQLPLRIARSQTQRTGHGDQQRRLERLQNQAKRQRAPQRRHLSLGTAALLTPKMADTNTPVDNDIAAQQEAAQTWEPTLKGPLVSDMINSNEITQEYARADPAFIAKTTILPEIYPLFRRVRGDGNCGWRAIAYCYFETLIQQGDQGKIASELRRLEEYQESLLHQVGGHDPMVFEDLVEELFDLFKQILKTPTAAMALLNSKLNDPNASMGLIYYLRLLTSSWLKGNADQYEPFCVGLTVKEYCEKTLLPISAEIEELGITLLVEVLLKPANMVLEIVYLDRSPGSQARPHYFPDVAPTFDPSTSDSMFTLLYRPGHYDILYRPRKASILSVHKVALPHQLQGSTTTNLNGFANLDDNIIASLPNASLLSSGFDASLQSSYSSMLLPSTMNGIPAGYGSGTPFEWGLQSFSQPNFYAPPSPMRQPEHPIVSSTTPTPTQAFHNPDPFRQVGIQSTYNAGTACRPEPSPCVTKPLLESPESTHHHMNERFQPHEWSPDELPKSRDSTGRTSKSRKGRGSG